MSGPKFARRFVGRTSAHQRAAIRDEGREPMKKCRHDFTRVRFRDGTRRQGLDMRSEWAHFMTAWERGALLSVQCNDCGEQLGLGRSDEEPVAVEIHAADLTWLEREGYSVLGPNPPAQHGRRRKVRRRMEVTTKGLAAIADDERRLIAVARNAVARMWP